MAIKIDWKDLVKRYIDWKEVIKVMRDWVQIWPSETPPTPPISDYLCFEGTNEGGQWLVQFTRIFQNGYPNISFEWSADWENWADIIWDGSYRIIWLQYWDRVYLRNKSETPTRLSIDNNNFFCFFLENINVSWDVNSLLCKNWVDTVSWCCFLYLFANIWQEAERFTPTFDGLKLPAMTLADDCYNAMFARCTTITQPPELPATNLATRCYKHMFFGCTWLTALPSLPATNLKDECYSHMFFNTPIYLTYSVVHNAFRIPSSWIWITGAYSTYRMFSAGSYRTPPTNTTLGTSISVLPEPITPTPVPPVPQGADYFCLSARWGGTSSVWLGFDDFGSGESPETPPQLEYSYDKENWTDWSVGSSIWLWERSIYIRNKSETQTDFSAEHWRYYFDCNVNPVSYDLSGIWVSWDVWYLLCKNSTTTMSPHCFTNLFGNGGLFYCDWIKLPATVLAPYCYYNMFNGAATQYAPELPATVLAEGCYMYMFSRCSSLTTLPRLNATILPNSCYSYMFEDCSNIRISTTQGWGYNTPYRIPSTWTWTAWENSFRRMFRGTWWAFTEDPEINTTYYTSNQVT